MPIVEGTKSPYQQFTVNEASVLVGECRNPNRPKDVGCFTIITNRPCGNKEHEEHSVIILSPDDVAALKMALAFVHGGRVHETLGEVSGARRESLIAQFAELEQKK